MFDEQIATLKEQLEEEKVLYRENLSKKLTY